MGGLRLTSDGSTPVDPFLLNTDNTGVVCFAAGTRIRTLRGPVAVEALRIGDLLATRDAGWQPLRWVSSQEVSKRALDDQPQFNPVRIPAGAFGGGLPARDLYVTRQHRLLLSSAEGAEYVIPAKDFCGCAGVSQARPNSAQRYFHLLFDRHHLIEAEGSWCESLYIGPALARLMPLAERRDLLRACPDLIRRPAPLVRPELRARAARWLIRHQIMSAQPLQHPDEPGLLHWRDRQRG